MQLAANQRRKRQRVGYRGPDHEYRAAVRSLRERTIGCRLPVAGDRIFDVAGHADNRCPDAARFIGVEPHSASDALLVVAVTTRHTLAEDGDGLAPRDIGVGEPSPAQQRDADRTQVRPIGGVHIRAGFHFRSAENLEVRALVVRPAEGERLGRDDAHQGDAWNRADAALHFLEDRRLLFRQAVTRGGEIRHGAKHAFPAESEILALQSQEALEGETGAGKKHQGERDFGADQGLAPAVALAAGASG